MDKIRLSIPGKPEYRTMIRLMSGSVAALSGLDIDAAEDIKTCVSEACKLISCHGEDRFSDEYEIEYLVESGTIEIKIVDRCKCHSIEKKCKPCTHCPEDGELGKVVIRSLMDEMEFGKDADGYKFVKMVKKNEGSGAL